MKNYLTLVVFFFGGGGGGGRYSFMKTSSEYAFLIPSYFNGLKILHIMVA